MVLRICISALQQAQCLLPHPRLSTKISDNYHLIILQLVKNPPADAGEARDVDSIPESERSPGRGHGNALQYSCLECSMDREA